MRKLNCQSSIIHHISLCAEQKEQDKKVLLETSLCKIFLYFSFRSFALKEIGWRKELLRRLFKHLLNCFYHNWRTGYVSESSRICVCVVTSTHNAVAGLYNDVSEEREKSVIVLFITRDVRHKSLNQQQQQQLFSKWQRSWVIATKHSIYINT